MVLDFFLYPMGNQDCNWVIGPLSFGLMGLYFTWKRIHFPKHRRGVVWPRLMIKWTKKIPIVRRLFRFIYAVLTASRLPLKQK